MATDSHLMKVLLSVFIVPVIWVCCAVGILVAILFAIIITFLPILAFFNPDVIKIKKGKIEI